MAANETNCLTCRKVVEAGDTVGGVCPTCLYGAGLGPLLDSSAGDAGGGARTTWSDAFPQFEARESLVSRPGFAAVEGELVTDASPDGTTRAVLLVWEGEALADHGGADFLLARIRALRRCGDEARGLADIADAGDLGEAVFLISTIPEGWRSLAAATPTVAGSESRIGDLLAAVGEVTGGVAATARVPLELDPTLIFHSPEAGGGAGGVRIVPVPARPGAGRVDGGAPGETVLGPGRAVGPYVLEERVGEGGFGEVWRARQETPVKRTVALKILKTGVGSSRLHARFEIEQQALARLDHPNVARFFDGGLVPPWRDRPFFAMEWVDGSAVTEFCRRRGLGIDERLRLFREICDAVHHAHQKGILHRDVKASNVLVTDGRGSVPPTVKIIDFGIARALEDPLTDGPAGLTRIEEIVGTPATMSPEQAAGAGGNALDVRTDVYGLGALLYELLAEASPFDPELPRDELVRRIREDDPVRPSTRVAEPATARRLRGELDWIVLRCLEKDPERRYASVAALAADLDRHAADEPVAAGPPELSYRAGKFARRHRVALAAAAVVAAALVAGGVALVIGLGTARDERRKALAALGAAEDEAAVSEAVNRFLTEELLAIDGAGGLASSDPRNHDIQLRTVLERAAARIDGRFEDAPLVEGALRRALAASFLSTGDFGEAGEQAERAVALLENAVGEDDARTLEAMRLLASVRAAEGRPGAAEAILDRVAAITGERPGGVPESLSAAESDILRGDLLLDRGRPYVAAGAYASALRSEALTPRLRAGALSGVAQALESSEARDEVIARHQRAVVFAEKELGSEDALTLEIVRRYARFLGDLEVASVDEINRFADLMKEVRALQEQRLGVDHPATLRTRFDWAMANGQVEPLAQGALRELEAIVGAAEGHYSDDHPEVLRLRIGLAVQAGRCGDHPRAAEILASVVEGGLRSVGASHPAVVDATRRLGESTLALGREAEALAHLRRAVDQSRGGISPAASSRQAAAIALGEALWRGDGRAWEAIDLFHREYRDGIDLLGPAHRLPAQSLERALVSVRHDRTGGLAAAAARRAAQVGGVPAPVIRSLLQLAVASRLSLRPSLFAQPSPPLPDTFLRLLEVESMSGTGAPKTELPPRVIDLEAPWRFLVVGAGDDAPPGWQDPAFDDRSWKAGPAPLGFGESGLATDLQAGRGTAAAIVSACFRHRFVVEEALAGGPAILRLRCDDGAVVHLNGVEVVRANVPARAPVDGSTRARGAVEPETVDFLIPAGHLVSGENLLAVRVFQHSVSSSDLVFSAVLHAGGPLPLERLADFDPAPAMAHLEEWAPGLAVPLDGDWRAQAECMQLAILGRWEEVLEASGNLETGSTEAAARRRWFRQVALERLGRGDEAAELFRRAIPARDPATPSDRIDLSDRYNALVTEPWHVTFDGGAHEPYLEAFPVGPGTFGGIPFDARGIVQLSSPALEEHNLVRDYPRAVEGILIGRSFARLHLLSATILPDETDAVVATVVVQYGDGEEMSFPIRYLHETLAYMVGTDAPPPSVRSGWRGPDPYRPGMFKELFVSTWENPRPDVEVASIDLRAADGADAALFVMGITVEP